MVIRNWVFLYKNEILDLLFIENGKIPKKFSQIVFTTSRPIRTRPNRNSLLRPPPTTLFAHTNSSWPLCSTSDLPQRQQRPYDHDWSNLNARKTPQIRVFDSGHLRPKDQSSCVRLFPINPSMVLDIQYIVGARRIEAGKFWVLKAFNANSDHYALIQTSR